jgi:hypothetical protein
MNGKRVIVGIIMGMITGVFCVIGLSTRIPTEGALPNNTTYLIGGWYNRVIMGALIGFAGEWKILKHKNYIGNIVLRGAIIGGLVSVGFAFFQQFMDFPFFIAGFGFGVFNDLVTSYSIKNKE